MNILYSIESFVIGICRVLNMAEIHKVLNILEYALE